MSSLSTLAVQLETDVLAAKDGDAPAFGRLVDETKSAVTAIALAIVGDYPASQDIAQDVFLAAWRNLNNTRRPRRLIGAARCPRAPEPRDAAALRSGDPGPRWRRVIGE